VAVRNLLYRTGLKASVRPDVPTIGVGNLRMGGTGKTPHTEYLIRQLSDRNIALLSRGYGRKSKGFLLADEQSTSADIGDEPAMMRAKFPGITVAVCEDRVEGIRRLMQLPQKPDLVVLDDVYQHRHLKPSVSILLTEYGDPYFDDHILPFGNLREWRCGSRRADIVIVSKCPPLVSEQQRQAYRTKLKLQPHQLLHFSQIDYGQPLPLYGGADWQPVKEVLLLTGIAHPDPLKRHIEKQCTVHHLAFPDHHDFSAADTQQIVNTFNSIHEPSKAIVTTEKDAMRLRVSTVAAQLSALPIYYIPITIRFDDDAAFLSTIKKFV
jgi:tetraacyldisaccharide 4'-kinase